MKVLIMGCSRVGAYLANLLDSEGHNVTIIDIDQSSFSKLTRTFRGNVLLADGTDEDSLRRAGIEETDVFVALSDSENRNIMAAQIAKHVFNVGKVICRIYDPIREEMYRSLGLDTVCSTTVLAESIRRKLRQDHIDR